MSVERIVIVGAGQGGLQAAASLRQDGFTGSLALIGAEPGLPYQRPPLSKGFLKTGEAGGLTLRSQASLDKNAIDLIADTRVTGIDGKTREVTTDTKRYGYDHLILATGTHNFRPPIQGLERALDLRTLADARLLRRELQRKRRIAVIGGGFIGLEFAAVARALGHEVTVLEAASRLLARAVSPALSHRFLEFHRDMGTLIRLDSSARQVTERSILCADGLEIDADLVLLAAGVRPNIELAKAAGLAVDNGVVVNRRLLTDDPTISALGDCAAFPDPRTGRLIRLESVQAATDHARLIAKRLLKDPQASYSAIPWFWSDQADWKLQIAGLASPDDESIEVGRCAVYRFDRGILSAVETINDAKTHMKARKLLAAPEPCTRDMLEKSHYDPDLPL